MCLMGKFKFIPNCAAILPVLSSGYLTLVFLGCSMWGHLEVISSNKYQNIFQALH